MICRISLSAARDQRLYDRPCPLRAASQLLVRRRWQSRDSRARQERDEGLDRGALQDVGVILDEQPDWHVETRERVRVDRIANRARQQRRQVTGRAADGAEARFREALSPVRANPRAQEQVESAVRLTLFGQDRGLLHHLQVVRPDLASRLCPFRDQRRQIGGGKHERNDPLWSCCREGQRGLRGPADRNHMRALQSFRIEHSKRVSRQRTEGYARPESIGDAP